ncbi:MAG: lytic transglycosylase domain-containing protein [Candidatus Magasanikbacteria bacterium]|nr:lytic transglycosylase domain-containing protein [Candidatus Magasanikbacteria bacterium]
MKLRESLAEDLSKAVIFFLGAFFGLKAYMAEFKVITGLLKASGKISFRTAVRLLNYNGVALMRPLYTFMIILQLLLMVVGVLPLVSLSYVLMSALIIVPSTLVSALLIWRRWRLRGVVRFTASELDALLDTDAMIVNYGPGDRFSTFDLVVFPMALIGQGLLLIVVAFITGAIYSTSVAFVWSVMSIGIVSYVFGVSLLRLTVGTIGLLVVAPSKWIETASGRIARVILDPALPGITAANVGDLLPGSLVDELKTLFTKLDDGMKLMDQFAAPIIMILAATLNLPISGLCIAGLLIFGLYQNTKLRKGGAFAAEAKKSINDGERFVYALSVLFYVLHIIGLFVFGLHTRPSVGILGGSLMNLLQFATSGLLISAVSVFVLIKVKNWGFAAHKGLELTLPQIAGVIALVLLFAVSGIGVANATGMQIRPVASYFDKYEHPPGEALHCLNGIRDYGESSTDHGSDCGPARQGGDEASRRIAADLPVEFAPVPGGTIFQRAWCWAFKSSDSCVGAAVESPRQQRGFHPAPSSAPEQAPAPIQRTPSGPMYASLDANVASGGLPPSPYNEIIVRASERHGVDKLLIWTVAKHESGFDPNIVGGSGEVGLMQLMPGTARGLGVHDRHDPEQNIMGGTLYLRNNLDACHQDVRCALARYNGGRNGMHSPHAQRYARRVMRKYQALRTGTARDYEPAPSRRHRAPRIESSDSVLVERETTRDSSRVTMARLDDSVCDEFSQFFLERMRSQGRCR